MYRTSLKFIKQSEAFTMMRLVRLKLEFLKTLRDLRPNHLGLHVSKIALSVVKNVLTTQ